MKAEGTMPRPPSSTQLPEPGEIARRGRHAARRPRRAERIDGDGRIAAAPSGFHSASDRNSAQRCPAARSTATPARSVLGER